MAHPELVKSWKVDHPINGTVEIYEVEDWSFELVRDADGRIYVDPDYDVNLENAHQAVRAWMSWAAFLETELKK